MEYIDLELPSKNLWAAENEDGYYKFDEAVAKFGGNLPTKEDFEELLEHCWKRLDNERKGLEFMGDNGAKLFLPALGYRDCSKVHNVQFRGNYWSATPDDSGSAFYLYFNPGGAVVDYDARYYEFTVRLIKRGGGK